MKLNETLELSAATSSSASFARSRRCLVLVAFKVPYKQNPHQLPLVWDLWQTCVGLRVHVHLQEDSVWEW